MKYLIQTFICISFFIFLSDSVSLAQGDFEKSKPALEKGKITIKVREGVGPFQAQTGIVSFGINSLDQRAAKYELSKLTQRFIHKPIPPNSGLPDLSRIYQIEFPTDYNVVLVAREFSEDPNIEYAEPIPVNYLAEVPNDALYSQQWYLHKIQAESAWDIHKGEDGDSVIILSITDTGCKYDHTDIGANIWNNLGEDFDGDGKTFEWNGTAWVFDPDDVNGIDDDGNGYIDDLIGWNIESGNMDPMDVNGHGTAVSGLANATTNNNLGVASISYNVELMPVKGIYYNSIIYAAENGADVISCSWGGSSYSQANEEAIEYADGLGSIVVAAAHNYNNSVPIYPASYPFVISVAAVDSQDVKTPYTNYGPTIDVSAPGPQSIQPFVILNLAGTYGNVNSGTSFSTPVVTGLLGLIKSYHPTWKRNQLVRQLLYTTENINSINPDFENLLGTGRINAYNALTDSNLTITPELKISMSLLPNTMAGNKNILRPNSVMDFSFRLQNCSHFLDANPLNITMTTNNPDIQIIDGDYTGSVAANSVVEIVDEFQIQIASQASTAIATLTFTVSANLPVVAGSVFEINLIVNPNGTLVWDGKENGQDYSGEYIKNYLSSHSYPVIYTTKPLLSYNGLDALFLSFGNYGTSGITNTVFDDYNASKVVNYLLSGGNVYLEGGDALGYDQSGNNLLRVLLGISAVNDGGTNIINSLEGQNGTLTEGMLFTGSTQINNAWVDTYTASYNGNVSFIETGYGNVGVQSAGTYGQKSFCFSYALSELTDGDPPSMKDTLIQRILDFFNVVVPVELTSFTVTASDGTAILNWTTASETNNRGFDIERKQNNSDWKKIGFVEGNGTTIQPRAYSFTDDISGINTTSLAYRLKQIDLNGSCTYSEVVNVNKDLPIEFALDQNFPNPFNPATTIKFQIPSVSLVTLKIYDVLGREVKILINEGRAPGRYEIEFNASHLSSGVYFYKLQAVPVNSRADEFIKIRKMVLLK